MKILAAHIDQFGQFYDQRFEFPTDSFVVIQGENESGKTTLTQFIKYMLFGFPSRSVLRSKGLLAEHDASTGGRLEMEHPDQGRFSLVRHLRKENGQALLYFESGESSGEEQLSEWLQGLDLGLYEAIFSLDLEGLKDLHKLKPEMLQHFLFSTGMMGNAKILELEKKLEREAGERFKPMGKNPQMNQTINELEAIKDKLKIWDQKKNQYFLLKEENSRLLKTRESILQRQKEQWDERQAFTEYKAIEPALIKYEAVEKALLDYPEEVDQFPRDGRERYESWRLQQVTLEGEKADLERQIQENGERLDQLNQSIEPQWLAEQDNIRKLVAESADYDRLEKEAGKVEERLYQERYARQALLARVDMGRQSDLEENLQVIDTGLQMKHELKQSLQELERLDQECAFIQREIAGLQGELTEAEPYQERPSPPLNQEEIERGARLAELDRNKELRHQEILWLEKDLMERDRIQGLRKKGARFSRGLLVVACLFFLSLILGGHALFQKGWEWGLGAGLTAIVLLSGIILQLVLRMWTNSNKKRKSSSSEERLHVLQSEERQLKDHKTLLLQYLELTQDEKAQEAIQVTKERLQNKLQARQEELDATQELRKERENRLRKWLMSKGYPRQLELTLAHDFVELIEQAKQKTYTIQLLIEELAQLNQEKERATKKLMDLNGRMGTSFSWFDLKAFLEKIEDFNRKQAQLSQTTNVLKQQERTCGERISRFEKECYNLWHQAHVETEEAFYYKEGLWKTKQAHLQEKKELKQNIDAVLQDSKLFKLYLTWLRESKWRGMTHSQFNEQLQAIEKDLQDVQAQIEDLNVQIRQVEEDEQHADLVHQYQKLRDQLKEEAYGWAVLKTAKGLLSETKETYKANRLPMLLKRTQAHFKEITNGHYHGLFYEEVEGFSVERADGAIFKVEELSRGTTDQLYVSIRLALIQLFEMKLKLPILVDDGFVNFDQNRLGQMMSVLGTLARDRQVLLLTCHSYKETRLTMEEWKDKGRKVAN